jgi:hypothetical protein
MKLYRSRMYPTKWFAYSRTTGWVKFPAEAGGWDRREPARGLDPIDLREVPVQLAAAAGIPDANDFQEAA